jgi:hypothetical protein
MRSSANARSSSCPTCPFAPVTRIFIAKSASQPAGSVFNVIPDAAQPRSDWQDAGANAA